MTLNPAIELEETTDGLSVAKLQTKRGLCTFHSLSVPLWWNLFWQSFADHEFNHRDTEGTERQKEMPLAYKGSFERALTGGAAGSNVEE